MEYNGISLLVEKWCESREVVVFCKLQVIKNEEFRSFRIWQASY